jgi:hypothetical protein
MEQIFYILISICCCMGLCGIYKCFKPSRITIHNNSVDIEEQTNTEEQPNDEEQTIKRFHSDLSKLSEISDLSDLSRLSGFSWVPDKENDCRYSELV